MRRQRRLAIWPVEAPFLWVQIMDLSYDPNKNSRNIALRGISFDDAQFLDWSNAVVVEDLSGGFRRWV